MKARAIIERCKMQGVTLQVEDTLNGEQLYAEPAGKLSFDLVEKIQESKEELIAAIKNPLDRAAKWRQALRWLDAKATELSVTKNDPAYGFMLEALDDLYVALEDSWCDATDEEFVQRLREYAAAGVRALRVGVEAEEAVLEKKGKIVSSGQVFRRFAGKI